MIFKVGFIFFFLLSLFSKTLHYFILRIKHYLKKKFRDFPGGAVVKNPPANAGDTGSSPGPGRFHMPQSN